MEYLIGNYIFKTMNSITKDDFLTMVRLQHLEVFTQSQLLQNTQILKSYIEKSSVSELSEVEKNDANMIIEDFSTLQKWEVMNNDFSKSICYTRTEQIQWEEPVKGEFGEIIKARGGVYKPTAENKKKGIVGQKYGEKERYPDGREKNKKYVEGQDPNEDQGGSSPKDLSDSEVNKIISDFFGESGKLGRSIKNMPVNNKTEPILSKLHKRVREKGYLTEQGVFDMLTTDERKLLEDYSE